MKESKRKNSIYIDGEKLREHIEAVTGKTIYEVSEAAGFSKKFLFEACKKGVASPTVQAVLKVYNIDVFKFEIKKDEPTATEYKQLSFDDLESERDRLFTERVKLASERQEFDKAKKALAEAWHEAQKKEDAFKEGLAIIKDYSDRLNTWLTRYGGYLESYSATRVIQYKPYSSTSRTQSTK